MTSSTSTLSSDPVAQSPLGRSFWCLWWAALVSGAGDGVRTGALPLLAAGLSRQPGVVAAVWFAGGLPFVLVGPVTGVLTDRWRDRRLVLRVSDVAAAGVVGLFAAAVLAHAVDIAMLAGLNFLLGAIQTLRDNTAQLVVPELVPDSRLDAANSRVHSVQSLTFDLLGPPIGALLVALSAGFPFVLDSVSFAAAAVLVSGIAVRGLASDASEPAAGGETGEPGPGILREMADGLRYLWRDALLRPLCLLVGLSGMAVTAVVSIAVLYALQVLHVGRGTYAALLAVVACGAVAGSLLTPVLCARVGRAATLRIAFALGPPAFLTAALTSNALVAALALTGVGAAVSITNVVSISLRQILVPPELRGRVNASYRVVAVGLTPVGAVLGGLLSQLWGLRAPFFAGAAVFGVGLLLAWRQEPHFARSLREHQA